MLLGIVLPDPVAPAPARNGIVNGGQGVALVVEVAVQHGYQPQSNSLATQAVPRPSGRCTCTQSPWRRVVRKMSP